MPDDHGDRLATAIVELYGAAPEAFTGRRAELAAQARAAGERAAAKAIGELRRPTRAAWVVNQLARADPSAPGKLAEMAGALRAAQQAGHGPRLRELSAARGALVDALTAQALAAVGLPDPPPSLRLEVSETLTAALADPGVASAFATGTLTRAVQWSGFGVLPADAGAGADAGTDADAGKAQTAKRTGQAGAARAPRAAARRQAGQGQPQARRQADEERLAREAVRAAAEREAQRLERHEEAERAVAAAAAAAADAVSAEDRLEAEVRDLEQRLTQARSDLAAARMRARRAETAERRARQARERLSGA